MCKACEGILVMTWNRVMETPSDSVFAKLKSLVQGAELASKAGI